MMGITDSRHYAHLSEHGTLRFCPFTLDKRNGDLARLHGTNERVSVEDYSKGICTYARMLQLLGET